MLLLEEDLSFGFSMSVKKSTIIFHVIIKFFAQEEFVFEQKTFSNFFFRIINNSSLSLFLTPKGLFKRIFEVFEHKKMQI